jgi:hypothetical protein
MAARISCGVTVSESVPFSTVCAALTTSSSLSDRASNASSGK